MDDPPSGFEGTLTCPKSIEQFCGKSFMCPNYCSSNGFCLNSKCYCAEGYSGVDCSIVPEKDIREFYG